MKFRVWIIFFGLFSFGYGVLVGKFQVFPYEQIRSVASYAAPFRDMLGRSSLPSLDQPEPNGTERFVVLGNSITYASPSDEVSWTGDHGMAASTPENDYVSVLLRLLDVPRNAAYVRNMYPLEIDASELDAALDAIDELLRDSDFLVLQLGDNTTTEAVVPAFALSYEAILEAAGPDTTILCVSTYWRKPNIDSLIEEMCERHNGHFVFIGDVRLYQRFDDPPTFSHPGVNDHPKDAQMQRIAERIRARIVQIGQVQ
ncbi:MULTISPECIES: hypothetical protein [Pseudomonadota]|uniref:SGNH/GDSL hydrolase family protein n=1 Tax=Pseudomonadota TaxID=1224 RepID=UPI002AFF5909|nr:MULTISPECIES: hypothetical protein [Pseudomonadota]